MNAVGNRYCYVRVAETWYILSDCRFSVDVLIEAVESGRKDVNSNFYGCLLGSKYLSPTANKVTDPYSKSGVVKIQNNQAGSMSTLDMAACESLLLEQQTTSYESGSSLSTIAHKLADVKRRFVTNKYLNCGFIIGSAAEVERLWSLEKINFA